ncbi:MAG: DUF2058 domain-containing protein [Myxococcales bacterium]|nr:DUF2058 domain-containing protein [Myxococcales bacterium]
MPTLREQLLQAGLVSAEQAEKAEERASNKGKARRSKRGGRGRGKAVSDRPTEVEDPKRLEIMRAIEQHKLREDDYTGEIAFNFTTRGDTKIRKLFVNVKTAAKLGAGELAIVENGGAKDHIIVRKDAVDPIKAVDPDAIRFHTGS